MKITSWTGRPRAGDEVLSIPAPDLHNINRRLAEGAARVDRHHLIRLAADHDLIVGLGRKTQVRNFVLPHASLRQPLQVSEPTNGRGSAKVWRP